MSIGAAAYLLGETPDCIRKLIRQRSLKADKVGRGYMVHTESLRRLYHLRRLMQREAA